MSGYNYWILITARLQTFSFITNKTYFPLYAYTIKKNYDERTYTFSNKIQHWLINSEEDNINGKNCSYHKSIGNDNIKQNDEERNLSNIV